MNVTVEIKHEYFRVPLSITGDYTAEVRSRLSGPMEDGDPGEPEDFNIESLRIGGVEIPVRSFSDDVVEELVALCILEVEDEIDRRNTDAAISRYESMREEA